MTTLPPDPLVPDGIAAFGRRLRQGDTTVEATTRIYLERIEHLDGHIGAYEHVDADGAITAARALDSLRQSGVDLGPLMGVPVAVKDIFAVEGMPTACGTMLDVADLVGAEGTVVATLRRAGCVFLGKVRTTEFAMGGAGGVNYMRGTPWNPWDATTHRVPGSSSSGSGAAVAAGLGAFALGSDTGGSVRGPAGFCGLHGLKTSTGLWPRDGVFPLSPTLDTIGLLCRSAADAALVFAEVTECPVPQPAPPSGLRLGRIVNRLEDDLEPPVRAALEAAYGALAEAGVHMEPVEIPELENTLDTGGIIVCTELLARLGRERYLAERDRMDPVIVERLDAFLDTTGEAYVRARSIHEDVVRAAHQRLKGFHGWLCPTRPLVAPTAAVFDDLAERRRLAALMSRNTRPCNAFGMCGSTTPIQQLGGGGMPVGLQLICAGGADSRLLSITRTMEDILGAPPVADVAAFASGNDP